MSELSPQNTHAAYLLYKVAVGVSSSCENRLSSFLVRSQPWSLQHQAALFTLLLGVVEEETSQLLGLCQHKEVELCVSVFVCVLGEEGGDALVLHMGQK